MTTINIITIEQYNEMKREIGTLMFGGDFYECSHHIDLKALKKILKSKQTIRKVIMMTKSNPNFKNIPNEKITYTSPMCCSAEDVGAYYHIIPEANMGMGFAYWATNHPFGDAFILLSQPRIKKAVPAVQFNIVESFDAQTKSYYIPEPLWDMIKKYAGIYNYNINWGKKWSDISSYYVFKECCPHVGEMTQKAFCKLGKENPDDMRRLIWKDLNNHFNLKSVWVGLEDGVQIHLKNVNSKEIGFRKLEYKFPLFKLPDWIKVGTEVSWSANKYANDQHKCCGKVVKITPKNISIDIYDVLEDKREHVGYGDIHIHYKWGPILRRSTFSVDKGFKLKDSDGWVYVVYYN